MTKQGEARQTETWTLLPCRLCNCLVPANLLTTPRGTQYGTTRQRPQLCPGTLLGWPGRWGSSLGPGLSMPAPFRTWCGQAVAGKRDGKGGPR